MLQGDRQGRVLARAGIRPGPPATRPVRSAAPWPAARTPAAAAAVPSPACRCQESQRQANGGEHTVQRHARRQYTADPEAIGCRCWRQPWNPVRVVHMAGCQHQQQQAGADLHRQQHAGNQHHTVWPQQSDHCKQQQAGSSHQLTRHPVAGLDSTTSQQYMQMVGDGLRNASGSHHQFQQQRATEQNGRHASPAVPHHAMQAIGSGPLLVQNVQAVQQRPCAQRGQQQAQDDGRACLAAVCWPTSATTPPPSSKVSATTTRRSPYPGSSMPGLLSLSIASSLDIRPSAVDSRLTACAGRRYRNTRHAHHDVTAGTLARKLTVPLRQIPGR